MFAVVVVDVDVGGGGGVERVAIDDVIIVTKANLTWRSFVYS